MAKFAWCLVALALVGMALAVAPQAALAQDGGMAAPAAEPPAAGQYTNVSGLTPFTAETNYMSLAGYLRWQTFVEQGVWLSVPEAQRIVAEQVGS